MATRHQIDVYFHNLWGGEVKDVTLRFSTSKSEVPVDTYTRESVAAGEKWGPLQRTYETGPDAEEFDFWQVEFTSSGDPAGKFSGRNKFACVIDSDVPNDRPIDLWISGEEAAFFTGYPESVGGRPGVAGYTGFPKSTPGGDYTCFTKLEKQ